MCYHSRVHIDNTSIPVWRTLALSDPGIREIVLPGWYHRVSALDSMLQIERSGYLVGVVFDQSFYVIAHHSLGAGKGPRIDGSEIRGVMIDVERNHSWIFQEEVAQRFSENCEHTKTIILHNHPHTKLEDLTKMCEIEAKAIMEVLNEEISEGYFDHLAKDGRVDIDDVVNEVVSRKLSLADIQNTPGLYHILLTDTYRPPTSSSTHINAYRLTSLGAPEKIGIVPMFRKPASARKKYREFANQYHEAFQVASERFETLIDNLPLDQTLDPRRIDPEYLFPKESN